jgi:hypothetical protein
MTVASATSAATGRTTDSGPRFASALPLVAGVVAATPVSYFPPSPCPVHCGPALATCRNVESPVEMRRPPFASASRCLAGGCPATTGSCHGFHPASPRLGWRAMAPISYSSMRGFPINSWSVQIRGKFRKRNPFPIRIPAADALILHSVSMKQVTWCLSLRCMCDRLLLCT